MDAHDREIIKAFVEANLGTNRSEAAWRVRSVNLTLEELIYAWYRAGTQYRGEALKIEIMSRVLEAQTFDEWALVATSFSLRPYRTWALEQLRKSPTVTERGITLLAQSKSKSLRRLAEELRARPQIQ